MIVCLILALAIDRIGEPIIIVTLSIFVALGLALGLFIQRQPQNKKSITFKMPFVPVLPLLSVLVNFYLMLVLNVATWIRFAVWMLLGKIWFACKQKPG